MAVDGNGPGESGPTHPGNGAEGVGEGLAVGGTPAPVLETRRRLVSVDDDPMQGRLITALFRDTPGLDVSLVHDGTEALESIVSQPPDIVLLDLGLPGIERAGDPPAHQDSVPATAGGGAHRLLGRPHRRPGHQAGRLPVPDQAGEHRRAAGDRAAGAGARRSAGGDREPAPQGGPRRGAGLAAGRQRGHADGRPPHPPGGRRPTSPC